MSKTHPISGAPIAPAVDIPVRRDEHVPPCHFDSFMWINEEMTVACRGTISLWFAGQVFMPKYDERKGAVNAL